MSQSSNLASSASMSSMYSSPESAKSTNSSSTSLSQSVTSHLSHSSSASSGLIVTPNTSPVASAERTALLARSNGASRKKPFKGAGSHLRLSRDFAAVTGKAGISSLKLTSVKNFVGWPGQNVIPPTPLQNPPTPLHHPDHAVANSNRNRLPLGRKTLISPFALPSDQPQMYMSYNLNPTTLTPNTQELDAVNECVYMDEDTVKPTKPERNNPPAARFAKRTSGLPKASQILVDKPTKPIDTFLSASAKFFNENPTHSKLAEEYETVDELGSGGFGFVVSAIRKQDNLLVAIKFIYKNRIPSQNLARVRGWEHTADGGKSQEETSVPLEAYLLRLVRHRGIVAFLDLFWDDTVFYLVMEYHGTPWVSRKGHPSSGSDASSSTSSGPATPVTLCTPLPEFSNPPSSAKLAPPRPPPILRRASCDLFECIEQVTRFNEDQARYVFAQIVAVVKYLNDIGICHRDIKDENIVVDKNLCVKLIDFGSAILFDVRKPTPYHTRFYGTVNFASAEILLGQPYLAPNAEVWSLGVLLSVLLTGETPFPNAEAAVQGLMNKFKVPIPAAAHDLLLGCLTCNPDARFTIADVFNHPWLEPHLQGQY